MIVTGAGSPWDGRDDQGRFFVTWLLIYDPVLVGGRFTGRRARSDIAEQLGRGQVGSEVLIDGMLAAAEASNAPFLLLIG